MKKYAALRNYDLMVVNIFEINDLNTMDGMEFPNDVNNFILLNDYNPFPTIGMTYNPETGQFS